MSNEEQPQKIRKRDGQIVRFDPSKISQAIKAASLEIVQDEEKAIKIAADVLPRCLSKISEQFKGAVPSVEEIQDIVEKSLMEAGYSFIAKKYILYRQQRGDIRQLKTAYGLKDDLKLPLNSLFVLNKRYLLKDDNQRVVETPGELFARVARTVSEAELEFKSKKNREEVEEKFFQMMSGLEFLPNSPTLMNAGTPLGQLSACFVLPVEDSMSGIFEALKNMALIHQTGGGCGFDFSQLRPEGDLVSTTKGKASGPLSFMSIFNQATQVIVQGGRRRGANMGILRCDHPDIFDFIEAKLEKETLPNFNLSVGVTDAFMDAVMNDEEFDLINPRNKETVRKVKARSLFDLIVFAAWRSGDPGLIFLDEINRRHPLLELGRIEATNPCGEVPLLPYESCNLGSLNLSKFVSNGAVDWLKLNEAIHWAVRFLDDVIEVNRYPLPEIEKMTKGNRKIGLGVMGFADMLIKMGIPYNSPKAEEMASRLMRVFHQVSLKASALLAEERGVFPNYERSVYVNEGIKLRHATVNTIAPTGTISIIADCSSGIEPLFALSYVRKVLSGTRLLEVHPLFEKKMKERGLDTRDFMAYAGRLGSIQNVKEIPEDIREIFVTAFDVSPEQHLRIQAAFQASTDNSVSKTVNLPHEAPVEQVKDIYLRAYQLKCKGITVYRYGSKDDQVLFFPGDESEGTEDWERDFISAHSEFSGGCIRGQCLF
ncbi:MAG: adenosylcobalamin-dependent ribonucleoside-diphosphate reductase [Acidobacteriota bacterium]